MREQNKDSEGKKRILKGPIIRVDRQKTGDIDDEDPPYYPLGPDVEYNEEEEKHEREIREALNAMLKRSSERHDLSVLAEKCLSEGMSEEEVLSILLENNSNPQIPLPTKRLNRSFIR